MKRHAFRLTLCGLMPCLRLELRYGRTAFLLALTMLASAGNSAKAGMLTSAGRAQGFSLSTFATDFPTVGTTGPLGIAFPDSGGVLVTDKLGNIRRFPTDTDGQSASANPPVAGSYTGGLGLAKSGGLIYATGNNQVVQLNDDGTLNHVVRGSSNATIDDLGIVANPTNGHLFVSGGLLGIVDINPSTGGATGFEGADADGMATDGTILYAALTSFNGSLSGHVVGYRIADGAMVFDSGFIPGTPDGLALGYGTLAGNLFVNTNDGNLYEINLTTSALVDIVTGGTRGDFVTPDPNGSLLYTQSTEIDRLLPPAGGSFVPLPPQVQGTPEPSSFLLMGLGSLGLIGYYRRRKRFA